MIGYSCIVKFFTNASLSLFLSHPPQFFKVNVIAGFFYCRRVSMAHFVLHYCVRSVCIASDVSFFLFLFLLMLFFKRILSLCMGQLVCIMLQLRGLRDAHLC